jgi:hypothetical protein
VTTRARIACWLLIAAIPVLIIVAHFTAKHLTYQYAKRARDRGGFGIAP